MEDKYESDEDNEDGEEDGNSRFDNLPLTFLCMIGYPLSACKLPSSTSSISAPCCRSPECCNLSFPQRSSAGPAVRLGRPGIPAACRTLQSMLLLCYNMVRFVDFAISSIRFSS